MGGGGGGGGEGVAVLELCIGQPGSRDVSICHACLIRMREKDIPEAWHPARAWDEVA